MKGCKRTRISGPGMAVLSLPAALMFALAASAHAEESCATDCRIYGAAGSSVHGGSVFAGAIGLMIPSSLLSWVPREAGPLSLHWDISLNHWRTESTTGSDRSFTQLAGLGIWRHTLGGPGSAWFVDLGLGASVFDHKYGSGKRKFSTTYQFAEALGMGYSFGKNRAYEISLRYQHISNSGIKEPNPGEDVIHLRFATRF